MKRQVINGIPMATEHEIQNSILGWLRYKGYYAMRLNSGGVKVTNRYGKQHIMRLAEAGTPDILAFGYGSILLEDDEGVVHTHKKFHPDVFFIEVKRPGNKPTILQEAKMKELEEYGARCFIATSIEDVEKKLEELK